MMSNLNLMMIAVKAKMQRFLRDERGDVNIVSLVVLIGVAVLLAIVFKDAIGKLLTELLNTIKGNSSNVVNETIPGVG